jgi:uncharacterized repeat protein (TIGR01451 family)
MMLVAVFSPDGAQAQTPALTISKRLCDLSTSQCPLASAALGQTVFYEVTIDNIGRPADQVHLKETLPAGFVLSAVLCGPTGGPMTPYPLGPIVANLALPANAKLICRFVGAFGAGSTSVVTNKVEAIDGHADPANGTAIASGTSSNAVNLAAPLPSDLSITKTLLGPTAQPLDVSAGPQNATYKIVLENLGANDLYLGSILQIMDRLYLQPQSVALNVRFLSATCAVVSANGSLLPLSDCLDTSQPASASPLLVGYTAPQAFVAWRYPTSGQGSAGLLRAGDKVELTVTVEVSRLPGVNCILAQDADGFWQEAHIVLTLPPVGGGPATTLDDLVPANNTSEVSLGVRTGATQLDPACNAPFKPKLAIKKVQVLPSGSTVVAWSPSGPDVFYQLTVQNLSSAYLIRNIHLVDLVEEGIGTPPFTATLVSQSCPGAICTTATPMSPQQLPGYAVARPVFGAVLFGGATSLGTATIPGTTPSGSLTASFLLRLRYSNPACDSYVDGNIDPIRNIMQAVSWDEIDSSGNVTAVTQPLEQSVTTRMKEAPACPLTVVKHPTVGGPFPPQLRFNVPYSYTVTYTNPDPLHAFTVGTLIDALRYTPWPTGAGHYAISLKVDYNYQCASNGVTGYPASNPAGYPNYDTAYAVENALPQQGVRLIQGGPVTFPPGKTLTCTVTVVVHPPAASDPYCSTAMLDNAAILDMSPFYNPNLPWPSGTPNMMGKTQTPLPVCFDWSVNKSADPTWTWQGGGPLSWAWDIYNAGPSMTSGGPLISDQFTPPVPVNSFTPPACTTLPACTASWLGTNPVATAPGAASVLVPYVMGHGQTLRTILNVQNAPAALAPGPNGLVCNQVTASLPNLGGNNYWKNPDPATRTAKACVKILATGSFVIRKVVTNNSGLPINPAYAYQINVSCTYPPDPAVLIPPVNLTLVAGQSSQPVGHIPVGSKCTVTETPPPVPPGSATCAYPVWQIYTMPLLPFIVSQPNVTITVPLTNNLTCRPVGALSIKKTTIFPPGMPAAFANVVFQVSCPSPGPNTNVPVPANGVVTIPNIPIVSTCTVTEQVPASTVPGCAWTATPNPASVQVMVPGGTAGVSVANKLVCAAAVGRLFIEKQTIAPAGTPLPATIPFNVNCGPGASNLPVSVPVSGVSLPLNIAAPATCTITEQVPPAPPGCVWSVTQLPPGNLAIGAGANVTVTVIDRLVCSPVDLTLLVRKFVLVDGSKTPVSPNQLSFWPTAAFKVDVTCGTNPAAHYTLSTGNNFQAQHGQVPTGTNCTIVEIPPPAPANCSWATSYPQGQSALITGNQVVRDIYDRLTCPAKPVLPPAGGAPALQPTASSSPSNSRRPSVPPWAGSAIRSGWGIMPSTLPAAPIMPAMSRAEPLQSPA